MACGPNDLPSDTLAAPFGSGTEDTCSGTGCTRIDGDDLGEATYAIIIKPGEEILFGGGRRFRVLDVVRFDEEDEPDFAGLLQVEAA